MSDTFDLDLQTYLDSLQNENIPGEPAIPSTPEPRSVPQRTTATFNYNGERFVEEVDEVTPEMIRNFFRINNDQIFELRRRNQIYRISGNGFDPVLIPRTFDVHVLPRKQRELEKMDKQSIFIHCNNKPSQTPVVNKNGQIIVNRIGFLQNLKKSDSKYLIDEKGNVIDLNKDMVQFEPVSQNYFLVYDGERNKQSQDGPLHIFEKSDQKTLENINLANSSVYWILFGRGLTTLSEINNDLILDLKEEDLKNSKALICGKSCQANLFQIASSINNLMAKQVEYILEYEELDENVVQSIEEFLKQLKKIGDETTNFISVLSQHLKNTEPDKNTVKLITELDDLERLNNENEEFLKKQLEKASKIKENDDIEKLISTISKMETKHILPELQGDLKSNLEIFAKHRNNLKELTDLVGKMVDEEILNVPTLLNLLKFLKQLVFSTTKNLASYLVFWKGIDVLLKREELMKIIHPSEESTNSKSSNHDLLKNVFINYERILSIWKNVGCVTPLTLNFSSLDDWKTMEKQIFDAQYHAEIAYHQAANRNLEFHEVRFFSK